jgi:RNA-directed DNA polymerase
MPQQNRSNFDLEKIFGGKTIEEIEDIIAHKEDHVRKITIPKRTGGLRTIIVPSPQLKYLQRACNWQVLMKYRPSQYSHGFVHGRNITSNALPHVGCKSIGHFDIKDFFDTIDDYHLKMSLCGNARICEMCSNRKDNLAGRCNISLYANRNTKFEHRCEELKAIMVPDFCEKTGYKSLLKLIIELSTINGKCCQGFATTPHLANIVLRAFDIRVGKYAFDHGIKYTRYADDMTVSSEMHTALELRRVMRPFVMKNLFAFRFISKKEKEYWRDTGRKMICGVVVNKKTNLSRRQHMYFRSSVCHATKIDKEKTTKQDLAKLKGYAAFFMSINPVRGEKYMSQLVEFEKTL